MVKIRAKTVIKLSSETINTTIEMQKGTSLVDVFRMLNYMIHDGDTLAQIQTNLNETAKRVNGE